MSTQPQLLLLDPVAELIRRAAEVGYPHEVCGLVVRTSSGALEVRLAPNLELAHPERGFVLDPRAIVESEARGEHLLAIFHSHPDASAELSDADQRAAVIPWRDGPRPAYPGVVLLVVAVSAARAGESRVYAFAPERARFVESPLAVQK